MFTGLTGNLNFLDSYPQPVDKVLPQPVDKSVDKFLADKVVVSTLSRHNQGMSNAKTFTYEEVIALLTTFSPKTEAVRLHMETVIQATTGEVAKALGWDKSNTGRRLEALAEDGIVECIDETHHEGKPGRPARLWRLVG